MTVVAFLDLNGAAVGVSTEGVQSVDPIPANLLPAGVANGSRIFLGTGVPTILDGVLGSKSYQDVRGTVAATVAALNAGGVVPVFGTGFGYAEQGAPFNTDSAALTPTGVTLAVPEDGDYLITESGIIIIRTAGLGVSYRSSVAGAGAGVTYVLPAAQFTAATADCEVPFSRTYRALNLNALDVIQPTIARVGGGAGDLVGILGFVLTCWRVG